MGTLWKGRVGCNERFLKKQPKITVLSKKLTVSPQLVRKVRSLLLRVCCNTTVFRLLKEHGANPDLPLLGIAGDQPRRWPDPDQQCRTIAFLVEECSANVNCCNDDGLTPLALACRQGYLHLVEYFLSFVGSSPHLNHAFL